MRAKAKDRKEAVAAEAKSFLETIIFQVDQEQFGINIIRVSEITKMMEITKLPRSLPFIEGIINLRGRIIPVLDLRRRLGFPQVEYGGSGRIIIVRMEGHRLGLLVDAVHRVVKIPRDTIEPVPPDTLQIDAEFIEGVGHLDDSLIILLRLDKLLSHEEKRLLADKARPS